MSKKFKLPKAYWRKGKSKFIIHRLREEGISSIEEIPAVTITTPDLVVFNESWFHRFINWLKKIFKQNDDKISAWNFEDNMK